MQICRNPDNLISHFEKQHWLLIIVIKSSVSKFFPQVKHPISPDWNIYMFVLNYQHFHRQQLCASWGQILTESLEVVFSEHLDRWDISKFFPHEFSLYRYIKIYIYIYVLHICISVLYTYVKVKVLDSQSCPTILWPHGLYSSPGSSVHGIPQARVLEWVAIPFCKGPSWARDWTPILMWWLTRFTSECFCIFAFIPSVFSVRHYKY